ncbi:MAG: hypothetical protein WC369_02120 [Dehalococcoidales bacterium]|jgi:hypothetical protein
MGLKGINIGETRNFISKHDQDKEHPTVFKIGILDSIVMSGLLDALEFDAQHQIKSKHRYSMELVRFGLKGIENFSAEFKTTKIVRWGQEYEVVDNLTIARIPVLVIDEIAGEIMDDNVLSEGERKN